MVGDKSRGKEDPTGRTVTIVVPVFNEEDAIASTLNELVQLAIDNNYALIVVDDGSTDDTASRIIAVDTKSCDFLVLRHSENRGYGASLKTAIRAATTPLIAITDADGTYPNERLPDLVERCRLRDMVVGARVSPDVVYSRVRAVPKLFLRFWISWLAGRKVPDINSGMRVFRKDVAEKFFGIFPNGFSFTITITLAMLTTHRDVEFVPIGYAPRTGESKIRPFRDTSRFIKIILRTGVYFAPLRALLPVFGFLATLALASLGWDLFNGDLTEKTLLLFLFTLNIGMFMLIADMIDKRSPQ